jgi:ATP-binding cassette subfamily C (CFTR/MRP) protein 1
MKLFLESASESRLSVETHLWLGGLIVVLLSEGVAMVNSKMILQGEVGVMFRGAVGSLLQKKAITVAPGVSGVTSAQGLLGNDVAKLYEQTNQMALIPYAFASFVSGFTTLCLTLGYGGAIATVLSLFLLTGSCGSVRFTKRAETTSLGFADERLAILLRVLEGVKAVKFSAWENRFMDQIVTARARECFYIRRFRLLQELGKGLSRGGPVLVPAIAFLYLSLVGYDMQASDVFAALTVFEAMRCAFVTTPLQLVAVNQWLVGSRRIEKYLSLPDVVIPPPTDLAGDLVVQASRARFKWYGAGDVSSKMFADSGMDLAIHRGQAIAVVGSVGSGKTSLLSALLGDLQLVSGSLAVDSSVGFAPQRAFIVSGTLRYNIALGRPWDESLFNRVVQATCLSQDLADLGGADVEIGERGVTLSGGQQQRVSVARALYGQPRLLILDDPLAAVDPAVARNMFDGLVLKRQEWTTANGPMAVLMALNQPQFLSHFDSVVRLDSCDVVEQTQPLKLEMSAPEQGEVVTHDDVVITEAPTQNAQKNAGTTGESLVAKEKPSAAETFHTIRTYAQFMGLQGIAFVLLAVVSQYAYGAAGFILARWVEEAEDAQSRGLSFTDDNLRYCLMFGAACLAHTVLVLFSGLFSATGTVSSSQQLHNDCMRRVLQAPVTWFDATPAGRLTSRFSSDCALVDTQLSIMTEVNVCFVCTLLALATTICVVAPIILPVLFVSAFCYLLLCFAIDRSNRTVRRKANIANGPVLGLVGEVGFARGQLVVRSMHLEQHYAERFDARVDSQSCLLYNSAAIVMWGTGASYVLGSVIAACSVLLMINMSHFSTSDLGLVLTYIFAMCFFLQMTVNTFSLFLTFLTALERLLQVRSDVPQEPAWETNEDRSLPSGWPAGGAVEFRSVQLVYRQGLPPALQNVDLMVPAGSSAGIVGRTGSGKSSLLVALFRIVEISAGEVLLDGIRLSELGLHTLRRAMAIIPQEPLLLEGTVRTNVDPFSECSDTQVSEACARVGLLDANILDLHAGGSNSKLSAGQKQLVSLARAILQPAKVVVFDEPTSNIDPETDEKVQRAMRSEFSGCTRMTIAHRLETVISSDQIIVMDAGKVLESGPPQQLLGNASSAFAAMVKSHGGLDICEASI